MPWGKQPWDAVSTPSCDRARGEQRAIRSQRELGFAGEPQARAVSAREAATARPWPHQPFILLSGFPPVLPDGQTQTSERARDLANVTQQDPASQSTAGGGEDGPWLSGPSGQRLSRAGEVVP